jgi:hypothetical protein
MTGSGVCRRRGRSRCYGKSLGRRGAPVSETSAAPDDDRRLPVPPSQGPSGGVSGSVRPVLPRARRCRRQAWNQSQRLRSLDGPSGAGRPPRHKLGYWFGNTPSVALFGHLAGSWRRHGPSASRCRRQPADPVSIGRLFSGVSRSGTRLVGAKRLRSFDGPSDAGSLPSINWGIGRQQHSVALFGHLAGSWRRHRPKCKSMPTVTGKPGPDSAVALWSVPIRNATGQCGACPKFRGTFRRWAEIVATVFQKGGPRIAAPDLALKTPCIVAISAGGRGAPGSDCPMLHLTWTT